MWSEDKHGIGHDKQAIGHAFGRAAHSYDAHAALQRQVGVELQALLPQQAMVAEGRLLDVGCGTGYVARHWHEQGVAVTALDLSVAMLHQARQQGSASHYVQGDAENLPFADGGFTACSSNLALQWCADLSVPVSEMYRVLAPQGRLVFSTLMAGSLVQLQQAWRQVDEAQHVNEFQTEATLVKALTQVGADRSHHHTAVHTMWYPSVVVMMKDLKGIGATHVHGERRQGLLSRGHIAALEAAMRPWQNEQGLLPLSYEVFYGVLQRD